MGPFEHREHERVHNPDQSNEDGQGEQRIDQTQQLIHLVRLRLLELGPALHLDVGVRSEGLLDALLHSCTAVGPGQHSVGLRVLEVADVEGLADQEAPDELVGLKDASDAHRRVPGERELDWHPVTHGEVVRVGRRRVDQKIPRGQRLRRARGHGEDQGLRQVLGRDAPQAHDRLLELELSAVHGRRRRDAGHTGHGRRHRGAERSRTVAVGIAHNDVGGDGLVDARRGGLRDRRAEHRDHRDQGESHHQGGSGLGRPARATHGVLATEATGHSEQPGQRPTDHTGHRPGHRGGQSGHPTKISKAPRPTS